MGSGIWKVGCGTAEDLINTWTGAADIRESSHLDGEASLNGAQQLSTDKIQSLLNTSSISFSPYIVSIDFDSGLKKWSEKVVNVLSLIFQSDTSVTLLTKKKQECLIE